MESAAKSIQTAKAQNAPSHGHGLTRQIAASVPQAAFGLEAIQQSAGNLAIQKLFDSDLSQANFTVSEPEVMRREDSAVIGSEEKLSGQTSVVLEQAAEPAKPSAPQTKNGREFPPTLDETGLKETAPGEAPSGKEIAQETAAYEQAPASAEEDPQYQAVVKQFKATSKRARTPPKKPAEKAQEVKGAAELPPEVHRKQKTYDNHLNTMQSVPPPKVEDFTVAGFTDKFRAKVDEIASKLPKQKDDQGSVGRVVAFAAEKVAAVQDVKNQNQKLSEPLREAVQHPPNIKDKIPDTPKLKVDPPGTLPEIKNARTAAPKPRPEEEVSMDAESRALDDALKNHNVGGQQVDIKEDSLAFPVSGEKEFDEAGEAKRKAQEEIRKFFPRYREQEKSVINKAQVDIPSVVKTGLKHQHQTRAGKFDDVLAVQQGHERTIEGEKGTVFTSFQKIYEETKGLVQKELAKLTEIETSFEAVLNKAEQDFKSWVRQDLEYIYTPGFFDYSDWKDIHEKEIKEEYQRLRKEKGSGNRFVGGFDYLYLEAMNNVRDRHAKKLFERAKNVFIYDVISGVEKIAATVVEALNTANKHIREGKEKSQKLYNSLDVEQQKQLETAFEAVKSKYENLEESVKDREREIINDMARTYSQSVGKLQTTFDTIKKDVLTSWLEKAWNKIKAVVNAIIEFAKRIAQLVGRIVGLVGEIVSSPRYFFNNLVTGIGQGFSTFVDRIDEFLATAFFDWLRGSSGVMVQLPKEWNPKGIFSLFAQLLNLSTETVWQRMEVVYDKTVANAFRRGEALLDKGLEIFGIIKNEGLGGLWDHIVESLGTLLSETLDTMKETVLYAAVKKVIFEIGKMLVPGGGFIAIAEKVIRLVQFLVEARNKILDLIESFIASMEKAVKGDIPGIVKLITGALTKFITVALDFLVTFFGLGSLKEKVERLIERMRSPIIRGIDFVLQKFKPLVMKGKELVEKGKEKVVGAGKAVVQAGVPEDPNERLRLAARASISAAKRLTGRVTQGLLNPILGGIRLRYGLTALHPYEKGGTWWVRASINPDLDQDLGVPTAQVKEGTIDVRDAADSALEKELREASSRGDAETIVGRIAERLRPEGLQRLEIGPESAEGEATIYAEVNDRRPLGRLIGQALAQSPEVPRSVSVRTAIELKLAGRVTAPTGFIEATHPGRRAKGGIWLPSSTGTELRMVGWNITALTSSNARDHAEDQIVKELRGRKDILQNVETITLQNFHLSPCDDCCGELSKLLSEIRAAQADNPKLKTAEIYWQELYEQEERFRSHHSATQTTWDGIRKLGGRGWTIHAPPAALPLKTGEIPKDIYERYVYKRKDIAATIKPAIDLSTPSAGSVQRRRRQ